MKQSRFRVYDEKELKPEYRANGQDLGMGWSINNLLLLERSIYHDNNLPLVIDGHTSQIGSDEIDSAVRQGISGRLYDGVSIKGAELVREIREKDFGRLVRKVNALLLK